MATKREHHDPQHYNKRASYYKRHAAITSQRRREWLGGQFTGLNKRPYPNACELCKERIPAHLMKQLVYHHWDDSEPSMGIWVHQQCHHICEAVDIVDGLKGDKPELLDRYRQERDKIIESFHTDRLL